MRDLFIWRLLCLLPTPVLPQTTRFTPQPRASVRDWENRLMSKDPKVRVVAEAAVVQGARRSFPLLRRLLNTSNERLQEETFEIIRRIDRWFL